MKVRIVPVAVAALGLAACTVGPDFTRPEPPAAENYGVSTTPAAAARPSFVFGAEISADWYRLFRSETLNGLVQEALTNNPDLEGARHGLLAAQRELEAVAGSALPRLNANGNIERAHINGSLLYEPISAFSATGNQLNVGLALAYNLDAFGGVRRSIEAQAAATASARAQALDTYVTLVDQVVVNAFDYAATQAQIEVTRSLVDELQAQFDLTQRLEVAGKITGSDTLQAQAQLESTRASLPALEKQRDAYRNALAQLVGDTPDQFALPQLTLREFALPTEVPVSLPATLVRQRPDILAAEDDLHQASAQVGVAEAARYPSFNISAQYAQQATKVDDLFTKAAGIWSFGLGVAQPLFDGGTLAARAGEATERYRQAQARYRSTVIAALVEVANALQGLEHDADGYTAHLRSLDAARGSRDLALEQLRAGKISRLQVLIAEQQFQSAALTQVQADAQRFADAAALFRALGGGWWNAQRDPSSLPTAGVSAPLLDVRESTSTAGASRETGNE